MELHTRFYNERDIEVPSLMEFINEHGDIETGLDVGCAHSPYYRLIRDFFETLDGVDIEYDKSLMRFLDHYIVGDAVEENLGMYDLVFAISVLEHYGVKQKPVDSPFGPQRALVKKMAVLAQKYLFFSFPYGVMTLVEGEFVVQTRESVQYYFSNLKDFDFKVRYFFNPEPTSGRGWVEIGIETASLVSSDEKKGVECVCIVSGVRKNV